MTNRPRFAGPWPLASFACAVLLLVPFARADGFAAGLRAGTPGVGAEISFPLAGSLRGRLAAGVGSWDLEFESERITYEGDAELQSLLAVLDWHPAGGSFHLSAGALVNDNRVEGSAPVRDLLLEANVVVPPGIDLGSIEARAAGDTVAPYAGLGWGVGPRSGPGWRLALDLGAAWHGEPDVESSLSDVPLDAVPGGRQLVELLLAQEERELEEELAEYEVFPVVALSLVYRF
ncbi:MAG TPA: hypothetical protein VHQ65_13660 [Thermoanaerobaculia bacterium]|nr:hypothetical protein [Thermoanaerobaculia bacterium]